MKPIIFTAIFTIISCMMTFFIFAFLFNYAPEKLPTEYYLSLGWYFIPPILNLFLIKKDRVFLNIIPIIPLSLLTYLYLYNFYNKIELYQHLVFPFILILGFSLLLSFFPRKEQKSPEEVNR